jgi:hypothetical protein
MRNIRMACVQHATVDGDQSGKVRRAIAKSGGVGRPIFLCGWPARRRRE